MCNMSGILSISIEWSEIGNDKCERSFAVGACERDALARNFGLLELQKLVVEVEVRRGGPDNPIFNLEGILQASVVQECVLCLGFVTTNIREDLSAKFIPEKLTFILISLFFGSGTKRKIGTEKIAHHTATDTKDNRIAVVASGIPNQ